MTSATPRQQKRQATFDRILEIATAAIATDGLDALTMQRLAAELGFAVGAVYRYFPSKDALVVAVQRRVVDAIAAELRAVVTQADAHLERSRALTPAQGALFRLWAVVLRYEALARERPSEFGMLSLTIGDPRPLVNDADAAVLMPSILALLQLAGELFARAEQAGALEPGEVLRRTVAALSSIQGALQLRKLERFSAGAPSSTALIEETVSTLLRGWGARPEDITLTYRRAARLLGGLLPGDRTPHEQKKGK